MESKISGLRSARAKLLLLQCLIPLTRYPQEVPPESDEECFSIPQSSEKGEVWLENYIDVEETAGGKGKDINGISYIIDIALPSADLVEAK